MVYHGKPSKACLQCRKRKLRCDLQRDSCGQCARAGRPCSGYRDPDQLRIRDESQTAKRQVLIRQLKTVPPTLAVTIDDRARNAFFFHYVSGPSRTYDVLERLYAHSTLDHHLTASVDAVSLAFFWFQFDCAQALPCARQKYSHALPLLNDALKSPRSARRDSTLLAVLLLDLFEKITNPNPRSADSWMSHVNGALSLIALRNDKHFRTYIAVRLSVRLSISLLISCVAANAPVPSALVRLRSELEPFLQKDDPKWQFSGLVVKYASLRRAMQDDRLSTSETLTCAATLDQEFLSLANGMPLAWQYHTTYVDKISDVVFEQHFHTYANRHITLTWNVLRVMRILLNDMIRTCSVKEGAGSGPLNHAASDTIDGIAKDICASAPQFTLHHSPAATGRSLEATNRLRCYTLIFPLYVAGLYASSPSGIKPWIVKHLRLMFSKIGIRNAGIVADILERGDGTNPWSVYAILGSYAFAA